MGSKKGKKRKAPFVMARTPNKSIPRKKNESTEFNAIATAILLGGVGYVANSIAKNWLRGMDFYKKSKSPKQLELMASVALTGATAWFAVKNKNNETVKSYAPAALIGMIAETGLALADSALDGKTENSQKMRVAMGLSKVASLPAVSPPATGQTTPPATGQTTPPASGQTTPAASGQTTAEQSAKLYAVYVEADNSFYLYNGAVVDLSKQINAGRDVTQDAVGNLLVSSMNNAILFKANDEPFRLEMAANEEGSIWFPTVEAMKSAFGLGNFSMGYELGNASIGYELGNFSMGYELSGNPFGQPF